MLMTDGDLVRFTVVFLYDMARIYEHATQSERMAAWTEACMSATSRYGAVLRDLRHWGVITTKADRDLVLRTLCQMERDARRAAQPGEHAPLPSRWQAVPGIGEGPVA
jgi:hypothetical protein